MCRGEGTERCKDSTRSLTSRMNNQPRDKSGASLMSPRQRRDSPYKPKATTQESSSHYTYQRRMWANNAKWLIINLNQEWSAIDVYFALFLCWWIATLVPKVLPTGRLDPNVLLGWGGGGGGWASCLSSYGVSTPTVSTSCTPTWQNPKGESRREWIILYKIVLFYIYTRVPIQSRWQPRPLVSSRLVSTIATTTSIVIHASDPPFAGCRFHFL